MSNSSLDTISIERSALWTEGSIIIRVEGPIHGHFTIRSSYVIIGRAASCDIILDDPSIAPYHVYLHLNSRGVYGVDLISRHGSYIGPNRQLSSWIKPGDEILIGEWRIILERVILSLPDMHVINNTDPLAEHTDDRLTNITLYPESGHPLALHSELIFVGSSNGCGVCIHDPLADHVHCVLVRTSDAVHIVDLAKRQVAINGQLIVAPQILRDRDILTIGYTRLECHIVHTNNWIPLGGPSVNDADIYLSKGFSHELVPIPPNILLNPETEPELIIWLLRILQITHGELIRRQSTFQQEVTEILRTSQSEQSNALLMSMQKIEELQREVSSFRIDKLLSSHPMELGTQMASNSSQQPRSPRGKVAPADDGMTAAWLMRRIQQVNREHESEIRIRKKGTPE